VQRQPEARAGKFVRLKVRDSGCGMSPQVMAHLFEPFFTTKDVGKGTGLGLATVYGIVKQHSGWIEVSSTVGVGSEFRVYVPLAPDAPARQHKKPSSTVAGEAKETILLVEDETQVRELASIILTRQGYKVIEADCGSKALDLWEQQSARIDLVFTDVIMPGGMSGRDLAERLRQRSPRVKIVFTSGYSPSRAGRKQDILQGLTFLPKPYTPTKLLEAIQEGLIGRC